ncbi:hypothetical protein [Streptomyces sp. NPDC093094]|uniref:hypothetical protein n=1 Tax=Streptomyces sp. NPDC093094 TaxID=3366026 RepID=UPI0037F4255C
MRPPPPRRLPLVLVAIDEAHHMLLSASSPCHLEAKAIVEQLTRRSLKRGIGVVQATRTPLTEDLGNSTVIRSQLLIGGAVFLRCATSPVSARSSLVLRRGDHIALVDADRDFVPVFTTSGHWVGQATADTISDLIAVHEHRDGGHA